MCKERIEYSKYASHQSLIEITGTRKEITGTHITRNLIQYVIQSRCCKQVLCPITGETGSHSAGWVVFRDCWLMRRVLLWRCACGVRAMHTWYPGTQMDW